PSTPLRVTVVGIRVMVVGIRVAVVGFWVVLIGPSTPLRMTVEGNQGDSGENQDYRFEFYYLFCILESFVLHLNYL
ncbi:hypothetical protein, partial [Flavobacterium sp. PL002]|uniref:hypothetical protein n=1 Tax=Flavobacterium sp. PL002 TaxID=1897058 RepID=UPI001CE3C11B